MPTNDLHGNAPDHSRVALLLIDVINDLEFEGGEALLPSALKAAENIMGLKEEARKAGIPIIYANDNFGRWRSDFREVVDHVLSDGVRGRPLAELLRPDDEDYFVLKPKHSAFYATTLDTLLEYLGAERLIMTGYSSEICVLLTAADAYMRDYELWIPPDCVGSADAKENRHAIAYMKRVLSADTTPSDRLDLSALTGR